MQPTVSIILPAFNRRAFLQEAVESVFAQTFQDWELVIADDGSDAETRSYLGALRDPRLRILCLEHCGNPSRVRNEGIRIAAGRYLAFLDSDDVWAARKLKVQLDALAANPGSRWSYTHCDRIEADGRPLRNDLLAAKKVHGGWIHAALIRLEAWVSMPSVVAERSLVDEIGGFDEAQAFEEQLDFCVRLALKSQVVAIQEPLCSIRAHDQHYSADRIAAIASWDRLYTKFGELVVEEELKAYCKRARARSAVRVAQMQLAENKRGEAAKTLWRSASFSWGDPGWWYGLVRSLPRFLLGGSA
jgi:glycosyltransferase involved in cell wall biosynthesis